MKIKSKPGVVAGFLLIVCSLWVLSGNSHVLNLVQLLVPAILGVYFILDGTFGII
jgi:hypothetical protein